MLLNKAFNTILKDKRYINPLLNPFPRQKMKNVHIYFKDLNNDCFSVFDI